MTQGVIRLPTIETPLLVSVHHSGKLFHSGYFIRRFLFGRVEVEQTVSKRHCNSLIPVRNKRNVRIPEKEGDAFVINIPLVYSLVLLDSE